MLRTCLRNAASRLAIMGTILLATCLSHAEEAAPSIEQASTTNVAELSGWITELDDNLFATRERAQARLEQAGLPALEKVAEAAQAGSLERSTRALNILMAWSDSAESDQLRIAALEKIVSLRDWPKESLLAAEILADVREAIALAKIQELGGQYTRDMRTRVALVNVQGVSRSPLQVIIDSHWKGGTEGLEYLKDVRRMVTLSFHSMPLAPEQLGIVLELPQLRWVELYGEGYTLEKFSHLIPTAPPGLDFDVRRSALLGVRGDTNHRNALVADVESESAADKAGIRRGDLIVEMEGVRIRDFKHLTEQISQCEGGDSVSLTIARPVPDKAKREELPLTVKFDCWGEKHRKLNEAATNLQIESVLQPRGIHLDRR